MTIARFPNGRINRAKAPHVAKNCRLTDSDFVVYAARTLYAAGEWMSTPAGERCRGDVLDCAPITPRWAYDLARDLESCIQMANLGRTLENVFDEWRAYDDAAQVIGYQPLSSNGQGIDVLAHYAACEYLGIGVGLSDIHGFPRDAFPWRGEAYHGARVTPSR